MAFNGSGAPLTSLNASNISSGTLAVARGGTGTSTPSLVGGTNITISGSWPNQTVTAAGGGVTSLNGQTGAITNTDLGAIGSYIVAFASGTTSQIAVGGTTAGSNIKYYNTYISDYTTVLTLSSSAFYAALYTGTSGGTTLSGTWRRMSTGHQTYSASCCGARFPAHLWVRIS
jgi:hypothetical protein